MKLHIDYIPKPGLPDLFHVFLTPNMMHNANWRFGVGERIALIRLFLRRSGTDSGGWVFR